MMINLPFTWIQWFATNLNRTNCLPTILLTKIKQYQLNLHKNRWIFDNSFHELIYQNFTWSFDELKPMICHQFFQTNNLLKIISNSICRHSIQNDDFVESFIRTDNLFSIQSNTMIWRQFTQTNVFPTIQSNSMISWLLSQLNYLSEF